MRRVLFGCLLALVFCCVPAVAFASTSDLGNTVNPHQLPDSSFIYDSSIVELAEADSYLDGQTVQVVGEAIGDNIRATANGSHRWISLLADDGSYATISVYMSEHSAGMIDLFGEYGVTGTMLQVRGTFNLVCSEHEGLSDLHADSVSVVSKGSVQQDELDYRKFVPGLGFIVLGLLLTIVFYFMRERQR